MLAGGIVAGAFVRAACQRHLDDLIDGPKRGLVWRPDRAQHAIDFYPSVLTVTAGAKAGEPFNLLPWQVFATGSIFGWYWESGRRRFRKGWVETGKGQAKSPWMAATGLYVLGYCGIPRAEIYAIAQDKDQANVLFRDAVAMCRADIPGCEPGDSLESRGEVVIRGVGDNAWKIEHLESASKFQSIANTDAISGPRPAAVLADEIHEFKSAKPIEIWKAALDKMPGDPLMLLGTNTPASDQIVGTDYSELYQKIVKGDVPDDASFAYIARTDRDDDPFEDESCWPKSLPALGITFPIENIRERVNTAKAMLSEALATKRLYFGIPVGSSAFWISEHAWEACQGEVDEAALKGKPCWLALDLSNKNDLTALAAVWDMGDRLYAKVWYWTPREGLLDRSREDATPYDVWVGEKQLVAVPGPVIEKSYVAQEVARIRSVHDVKALAFDPAGIDDFIKACGEIGLAVWKYEGPDKPEGQGLKLVSHAQGTRVRFEDKQLSMPRSIERFEDAILKQRIVIERNKVTRACAANALVISDPQNNRAFDKKRSRGRIDGTVALCMATGLATQKPQAEPSMYATVTLGVA